MDADRNYCKLVRNSAQSIPDETWTKVQLNVEEWDSGSMGNTSTYEITIPEDGIYLVTACCGITSLDIDEGLEIEVRVNDSETNGLFNCQGSAWTGQNLNARAAGLMDLDEGDELTLHVWHNEDAASNTLTGAWRPHLAVVQVANR